MAYRRMIEMRGGSKEELKRKVKEAKELIMEICEDVDEMDEFSERDGEWEARGYYGREDDRMNERRGMRRY